MIEHAHTRPAPGSASYPAPPEIARLGKVGLAVGVVGIVLLAIGFFTAPPAQFFRAYLLAVVYWLSLALGCLALSMVHHLSGGAWGLVVRRIWEAASRTLPLLALFFVPLAFGLESLYPWAQESLVAADPLLAHKAPWLNETAWLVRAALYFAVWVGMALILSRWSKQQDETSDPDRIRRLIVKSRRVAAPGLVLYAITITLAAIDWLMSVDPHWYSTMYGVWFLGGQGIAALGFLIPVALLLARRGPLGDVLTKKHFHDYGKLLLAFTMLWAYFSLSQLLIIWSGNIPEEVIWYQERFNGGWQYVGLALALLHFALPFLLLLSRDLKREAKLLAGVALFLLAMHWVDYFWNIAPVWSPRELTLHWLDLVAPLALGGIWLWRFCVELAKRPLLPIHDPYLHEEVLADGGH